ncbi:hypothetical protein KDK77_00105 [bacterium]|nr:hypothetical protein [bacterium]MCP5461596.1 hypothetical protein [bacterium]
MKIHINARSGLGDSVYFLSVLQSIVQTNKELCLSLFCWNAGVELFGMLEPKPAIINANDIVSVLGKTHYKHDTAGVSVFDTIGHVDYYIDLQPSERYRAEVLAVDAKVKIAVNPEPSCESLYGHCFKTHEGEHILQTYRRMASALFSIMDYIEPGRFVVSNEMSHKIDKSIALLQRGADRPIVCIHPGAKDLFKLWDVRRWGAVVNWLVDTYNFLPVIIGSSLRFAGRLPILDIPSAEAIQRLSYDRSFNFAGNTDSVECLIALIQRCQLYVGLDTGPTHIAAACSVPTVELFKIQTPHQFSTWRIQGNNTCVIPADSMDRLTDTQVISTVSQWDIFKTHFSPITRRG